MVWRSRRLPVWQKLMIGFQIGQPLAFVIGVACLIMGLPFMAGVVVADQGLDDAAVLDDRELQARRADVDAETFHGSSREGRGG